MFSLFSRWGKEKNRTKKGQQFSGSPASKWPRQAVDPGVGLQAWRQCPAAWLAPSLRDSRAVRVAHQYVPKV